MFNNLLTDLGYTVMDIDYRGSAGYGGIGELAYTDIWEAKT
jgi:dipeptidyl aminopeptidase/acylaminoacyl peptidase